MDRPRRRNGAQGFGIGADRQIVEPVAVEIAGGQGLAELVALRLLQREGFFDRLKAGS